MNYRIICFVIGWVLKIEAAFMILPLITGIVYQEQATIVFVITGLISFVLGMIMTGKKPSNSIFT